MRIRISKSRDLAAQSIGSHGTIRRFSRERAELLSDVDTACSCAGPYLMAIAVGTAVSGGPPHRSVREELPHTALALSRA